MSFVDEAAALIQHPAKIIIFFLPSIGLKIPRDDRMQPTRSIRQDAVSVTTSTNIVPTFCWCYFQ